MGVQINGDTGNISATKADYSGNVTIGGTLTYEDVTNIDSVGLVTARNGIEIGARPGVAASISVDGNMIVSGITTFTPGGSEIVRINSGGLLVYNDVSFFGASTHAYWDSSANQFALNDYTKLSLGSSSDLSIYHDGTHSYIANSVGNLRFQNNGTVKTAQFEIDTIDFNPSDNSTIHMRKDSSGRLLLGTTTEGQADADNLTIADSGSCGITIRSGTSAAGSIYFSDATSGAAEYDGAIIYNQSSQYMSVYAAQTERLRIFSNGHLNIGDDIVNDTGMFKVQAADGQSADQYVGQFNNLEATAGQSYGVNIRAGSNSTDHGFRVMNRANDTTQFLVRGDGQVTKPAQFHILVRRASNQTGYNPSQGFGTGIIYNEVVTTQGTDSSVLDTSNGRITVPVAGIYFLEGSGYSSTAAFTQGWFTKNGSRLAYSDWMNNSGLSQNFNANGFHKLAANDTIGFKAYGSAHTSVTVEASIYHTWMRITLVG